MTDVAKGAPNLDPPREKRLYKDLVDAAFEEPGEWFSMPVPEGRNSANLGSAMKVEVAIRVADFSTRDGRVWVRIRAEDDR